MKHRAVFYIDKVDRDYVHLFCRNAFRLTSLHKILFILSLFWNLCFCYFCFSSCAGPWISAEDAVITLFLSLLYFLFSLRPNSYEEAAWLHYFPFFPLFFITSLIMHSVINFFQVQKERRTEGANTWEVITTADVYNYEEMSIPSFLFF